MNNALNLKLLSFILAILAIFIVFSIWLVINFDIHRVKSQIREVARDPSSVKFYDVRKGSDYAICGEFNAKNGFGGYSGKERFVATIDGSEISILIEGRNERYLGQFDVHWIPSCSKFNRAKMSNSNMRLGLGCDLASMAIGENCNGLVYAGGVRGNRLYTTAADQGQFNWNNGTENWTLTDATSSSNGLANTNALVTLADAGAPYNAANACRNLGAEWYLPSQEELNVLYSNRVAIGGFNLSGSLPAGWYWSSSEDTKLFAQNMNFKDGSQSALFKNSGFSVRCIRKGLLGCDLPSMAIGENCNGLVYAGESGGNRIYTTASDQGQFSWSNNAMLDSTVTGAASLSDGLPNTNTLVALADAGAPYNAANACRNLGAEWYLPSQDELNVLYTNRVAIGGFNLSNSLPAGRYWSSSEFTDFHARYQRFSDGSQHALDKSLRSSVRCVRR
ncbi:MAG: DUF1566 domain-containing protein [Anaerolineales bacterium]|nr:DUF1566 domain-containing protein [Anaerolineales bacterium]